MDQRCSKMETVLEEDEEQDVRQSSSSSSNTVNHDSSQDVQSNSIPGLDKYNLRTKSIQNRIEIEKKRKSPTRKEPKPKQRPAPLSKYRRKTANARERTRMQEINDAFEELRAAIPEVPDEPQDSSKGTKITTLRLAVNYIAALARLLEETDPSDPSTCNSHHQHHHHQSQVQQQQHHHIHNDQDMNVHGCTTRSSNVDDLPPFDSVGNNGNVSPTLGSLELASLDLGLSLDPSQFTLTSDDLVSELDSSFLVRQISDPSSCGSSDLLSHDSPSTATDSSIESFATGWDFTNGDSLGDVADTFDLILESEETDDQQNNNL